MEHRVSNSQLEELINYLMEHQSLAKGVGLGRSKETIDRQWEELASKLNAHGRGASKTGHRWKRYWAEIKHKVKTRASAQKRDASGTGGGPARQDDLSDIDKKVLAIMGDGAAYGDTQPNDDCDSIESKLLEENVTEGSLDPLTAARLELVQLQMKIAGKEHLFVEEEHKLKMEHLKNEEDRREEIHILQIKKLK